MCVIYVIEAVLCNLCVCVRQDKGLCTLASLVDESVSGRMVAAAFHSTIQLWSVMFSNDGCLVTRDIGLSGEKGSEESPVTVMGRMCLNGAT